MATYIQGVTTYIPQIQPFQPDFNFLGNILQTKQSRYDANKKQLSSVYGTLLNSPLTHQDNITAREDFFKSIEQDINKMAGMDLSLQQNVDQAMNVFKGLYEDKYILKDMAYTKNWMNQKSRGEMLKLCTDPKKCGGSWWEGGDKYLDYKRQEFANASREQTMNMKDVSYVAAQNFTDDAIKAAKDAGFKVKMDKVQGDYIVTTTNGTDMVGSLAEWYISKYGQDPKVMDYLKASAYVKRKDWVGQNLGEYNNDEKEANMAYVSSLYAKSLEDAEKDKNKTQKELDIVKAKSKLIDKTVKEDGYLESSGWLDAWLDMKGEEPVIEQKKQIYDKNFEGLKSLGINRDNIDFVLDNMDNNVAIAMLKQEALNSASLYAANTMEVEYKANQVALQNKQIASTERLAKNREGYIVYDPVTKQNVYVPGTDHMSKVKIKEMEQEFEKKQAKEAQSRIGQEGYTPVVKGGTATGNLWDLSKNVVKNALFGQTKNVAEEANINKHNEVINTLNQTQRQMINEVINTAKIAYKGEKASTEEIAPAIYDIAKGAGINVTDPSKKGYVDIKNLIQGSTDEAKKFNDALNESGNLKGGYDAARAITNPKSYSYNLYKKWTEGLEQASNNIANVYKEKLQVKEAIEAHNEKQALITKEKFNAEVDNLAYKGDLETNDNVQTPLRDSGSFLAEGQISEPELRKNLMAQLLDKAGNKGFMPKYSDIVGAIQYLDSSTNTKDGELILTPQERQSIDLLKRKGITTFTTAYDPKNPYLRAVPITANAIRIANFIKNFANENKQHFGELVGRPQRDADMSVKDFSRDSYQNALAFVAKNIESDFKLFKHNYRENASSWNNLEGGKTTGMKGMALASDIDAANLNSIGAKDFFEFSKAMDIAGDRAVVTYGDFVEVPESSNATAKKILDLFRTTMATGSPINKDGIPTKEDRALGNFEITGIAAHDPNLIGFRVVPGMTWGEQHTSTENKTRTIPENDTKYNEEGIVVFLPKDAVPQNIIDKFETTDLDFVMQQKGSITIENPMGGTATLAKEGLGYRLNMGIVKIDPQTGKTYYDMTTSYQGPDLILKDFKTAFENDFDYMATINTNALQALSQEKGIKDPNQLFGKK
jgi:hypothetical protein